MPKFVKGQSGNPSGKKPGTKSKRTLLGEQLLNEHGEEIIKVVIDKAKAGDPGCLKLLLPRLIPARRGAPVQFDLPDMSSAAGLNQAVDQVLEAVASGQISPQEASEIGSILTIKRQIIETADLEVRLEALELLGGVSGGAK